MIKMTSRRESILRFIREYIAENSYPPAIREICAALNIKSPSTVHAHLKTLCDMGYLTMTEGRNRSIMLNDAPAADGVPLVGRVAAGLPITAQENIEDYLPFDRGRLSGSAQDYFALRVQGDSMIDDGILDGDIIIVHRQPVCENGEIAVAMVDGEATVKRIYREAHAIRLQPANDAYEPMYFEEVTILGKVASLVRDYQ
ncbi:MAG: transcriptional repressor LexA [Eubacteriales bacterium]